MRKTTGRVTVRGALLLVAAAALCGAGSGKTGEPMSDEEKLRARREEMVTRQIEARGVKDPRVLDAMRAVPRHRFVPASQASRAYDDNPLPIGWDQTISQPYIVALMTELLELAPGDKVLEIGTGSGYQAAVLAELADSVFSIEIVPELAEFARENLAAAGYRNANVRAGDGYRGWPEAAPFPAIIVTAAPDHIPEPLIEQLAEGGRLVIPVGDVYQELMVAEKAEGRLRLRSVIPVRFVPMTGEAER